jgi:hypothetical protein
LVTEGVRRQRAAEITDEIIAESGSAIRNKAFTHGYCGSFAMSLRWALH